MTAAVEPATAAEWGDAAALLWRDAAPYARRQQKLRNARTAIALALERRPQASAATGELIAFLAGAGGDDAEGTELWSEPAAYHWVRTLYDLTAVVLGGAAPSPAVSAYLEAVGISDPTAGFERLIDDHKLFALAIALRSGHDVRFDRPWSTALPLAIPATPYVLAGDGAPAEIHGVRGGQLEVSHRGVRSLMSTSGPGRHTGALALQCSPMVREGGVELRLSAEAFSRPGMEMGSLFRGVPSGYQAEHAALLERTLAVVARHHPETIAHCRAIMRLAVLKPALQGQTSNLSHSDFPGSMALSVVHDPYWLGDALIHEVHHNRLFHLEEIDRFFADPVDNLMLRSEFYSPWREEPRPLHGILHAIYVNLPLWHFWHDVRRSQLSPERDLLADGQLVQTCRQLEIAVRQIERHARLSAFGAFLFGEMAAEVRRIRRRADALGLNGAVAATRVDVDGTFRYFDPQPNGRPTTVGAVLLAHLRAHDVGGQCADLQSLVAEA